MKVIPPSAVTDTVLVSSNLAEADYPEWAALSVYAKGARVIRTATHRIYESVGDGNVGNNPASGSSTAWINVGPTNRWAMFDQAIGTASQRSGEIIVGLVPQGAVNALAVLDTVAASIRVQLTFGNATIYDQTRSLEGGLTTMVFDDLPPVAGARITVTAAGSTVSIGTMIAGNAIDLGTTGDAPQIGLTSYSRNETDDYGVTSVVKRSSAKTMAAKTRVDSDQVDRIRRQLEALDAVPCLWIGETGFDSLALYGFYKDFSIDLSIGQTSYCNLTIQGLSAAGIASNPVAGFQDDIDAIAKAQAEELMRAALYRTQTDAIVKNPDGSSIRTTIDTLGFNMSTLGANVGALSTSFNTLGNSFGALSNNVTALSSQAANTASFVSDLRTVDTNGTVKAVRLLNSHGYVSGSLQLNNGSVAQEIIIADVWAVVDPAEADNPNAAKISPLHFVNGALHVRDAIIENLDVGVVTARNVVGNALFRMESASAGSTFTGSGSPPSSNMQNVITYTLALDHAAEVNISMSGVHTYTTPGTVGDYGSDLMINGAVTGVGVAGGANVYDPNFIDNDTFDLGAGTHTIVFRWRGSAGINLVKARLVFLINFNTVSS